jgi:hypothetical protein
MSEKDLKQVYEGVSKTYKFIQHSKSTTKRFSHVVSQLANEKLDKLIAEGDAIFSTKLDGVPEDLRKTAQHNLDILKKIKQLQGEI